MLSDGLTAKQADGAAPETTEVIDVAQLLLESVRRELAAPTSRRRSPRSPLETGHTRISGSMQISR